jgi:biopolymer transport protein ExbD
MRFTQDRKTRGGIDMTPLIDIMFQLLLFFILSTTFRNAPSFEVNLPESSSEQFNQRDNSMTITLTENEEIVIENNTVKKDDVLKILSNSVINNPSMVLVIEADKYVQHGKVVELMDLAQEAGIQMLQVGAREK